MSDLSLQTLVVISLHLSALMYSLTLLASFVRANVTIVVISNYRPEVEKSAFLRMCNKISPKLMPQIRRFSARFPCDSVAFLFPNIRNIFQISGASFPTACIAVLRFIVSRVYVCGSGTVRIVAA